MSSELLETLASDRSSSDADSRGASKKAASLVNFALQSPQQLFKTFVVLPEREIEAYLAPV